MAALLLLAAGCSPTTTTAAGAPASAATSPTPSRSPSPSPAGEPKTYYGAKAAVDRLAQAAATHDGGTLWDLLTSAGQAAMTRDDYIKVVNGCPKLFAASVLSVAMNAAGTTATVTVSAPGGRYTFPMIYEAGRWKHQPSDEAIAWMGLGADKALTTLRNAGAC